MLRISHLARFYVECSSQLLDKHRGYEYRSTSLDATVNIYQQSGVSILILYPISSSCWRHIIVHDRHHLYLFPIGRFHTARTPTAQCVTG